MNYTKGEWKIVGDKAPNCGNISITSIVDYSVKVIARIEKTWDNPIANAHLIAAAPEMHHALECLITSYELHCPEAATESEAIKIGKAALAKANGKQGDI